MNRTPLFVLGGLMLGGIIHIAAVLKVPVFAPADTWSRIASVVPVNRFQTIATSEDDPVLIPMLDPLMTHAVCRYSLNDGAIRLRAKLPSVFWSVALYNRRGENVFSVNDRSAGTEDLDMLVLTVDQLAIIRENPPEELEDLLVIETPDRQGFALLHVFDDDPALRPEVMKGLKDARCDVRPF